jgi:putative oxidoreductase
MVFSRHLAWRILEVAIGFLFIYTGALKAWDPVGFAGDIDNYHIVPWVVAAPMAFYLPWLEIICGVALLFRRATAAALAITGALMLVFIGAGVIARMRGIDVSCGCFGHAARGLSFAWHIAIDLAILGAIALLSWREKRRL